MAYTGSTAAILSNYDEVLKTFYLPAIQEQLNGENVLSAYVETNEKDVAGKNATIQCHYGRNKGTGARADGGALPEADYQKFKTAVVPMRYQYGRVTFSGPTIAATRTSEGAYAEVVNTEIRGIVEDLAKEVNRQLWGCGYGILARWRTGANGSTPYTVQKMYTGNSAGGDGFGSTFGAKYLDENTGLVVAIPGGASSSAFVTMSVSATDLVATTLDTTTSEDYDSVTCTDASISEAAGTFFVRPGNLRALTGAEAAGYARLEMMGIRGIVTDQDIDEIALFDGTNTGHSVNDPLQGLAVATYTWWKAQVDTGTTTRYASQRALTLKLMQKMFDKVEIAAGKNYGPNMIITTHAIRREYLELCRADRRIVNEMQLDGGFSALDYNGVPLLVDADAIDGEIYFLTTKDLQIYRMSDYDWMSKDGAILSRITGYDAYEAVLFRYAEMGCTRRNSHGVICDLAYEV